MFCCREFITEWDCSGRYFTHVFWYKESHHYSDWVCRRAMLEVVNYDIV